MATSTALPSTTSRAGHAAHTATFALSASTLMAAGALGGAYLAVRYGVTDFVDKAMKFNNYVGVVITASMALASFAVIWGSVSARVGKRRWAATGFGVAAIAGLSSLNLVWFLGQELKLPAVGGSAYAIFIYALLTVGGLAIAAGIASSVAGLVTSFGGHANPGSPSSSLAFAWGQHLAGLSWLVVFLLVFLKK